MEFTDAEANSKEEALREVARHLSVSHGFDVMRERERERERRKRSRKRERERERKKRDMVCVCVCVCGGGGGGRREGERITNNLYLKDIYHDVCRNQSSWIVLISTRGKWRERR